MMGKIARASDVSGAVVGEGLRRREISVFFAQVTERSKETAEIISSRFCEGARNGLTIGIDAPLIFTLHLESRKLPFFTRNEISLFSSFLLSVITGSWFFFFILLWKIREAGTSRFFSFSWFASDGIGNFGAIGVNAEVFVLGLVVLVLGEFVAVANWNELIGVGAFLRDGSHLAEGTVDRIRFRTGRIVFKDWDATCVVAIAGGFPEG